MDRQEQIRELLDVVSLLGKAQAQLDALVLGDPSGIPNALKHALDEPKERIRAYARALSLSETPSGNDKAD